MRITVQSDPIRYRYLFTKIWRSSSRV